ncbi:acyltransferase [Mucilaginibacter sp.]|uniref:acyltransferase family protein n=1 Tax=Mucilaginibacter sp. TaxID=1882438 RepID=UPI0032675EEE
MNPATAPQKEITKLNHIDLLRGVAVILVVITHVALTDLNISEVSRSRLIFGQIGVQLFFFLSAYTLCRSMNVRREQSYIRNFYIRRLFRIAPLYYTGIVLYFLLAHIPALNLGGPLSKAEVYTPGNILLNVSFLHSFVPGAYNSIVPGGWSIGTEMLFYLMFPAIFLLYSKINNTSLLYLIPVLAFILANIYMVATYQVVEGAVFTDHFYFAFILNQLPVFALGISYFFLERSAPLKISPLISLAAFLSLFGVAFLLSRKLAHNINLTIFIAGISFGFLFNFFKNANVNLPLLHRIGQLSFSIYIFHFLFAYPLAYKISTMISGHLNASTVLVINFVVSLSLSAVVAMLSEKYIEKPGINLGKKLIKSMEKPSAQTLIVK